MKVLITGGAGYIGSTIAACCTDNGITPIILDDYSKGLRVFAQPYAHYQGDIADRELLKRIVECEGALDAVIHCAGKIVVPDSVSHPLAYYDNNLAKAIVLLKNLVEFGVTRFIFSSTASMYEPDVNYQADEHGVIAPQSPYAASKHMLEGVLKDFAATGQMDAVVFRYFNPIGADPQMRCGLQNLHPTHALGKMIEAFKSGRAFTVTGTNWPTRDGSGIRDYVHVWDLARAHVDALRKFDTVIGSSDMRGFDILNLGSGAGTTVFELAHAFGEATGTELALETAPPRLGDVVGCSTITDKARTVLGWQAVRSLAEGVRDSLAWSEKLPEVLACESRLRAQD